MPDRRRHWGLLAVAGAALLVAAPLGVAELLSRPYRRTLGAPPEPLRARSVHLSITREEPPSVAGWEADGQPGMGAVLLLHGVRSDRRQMLARARWLQRTGHAVLLIDLPSHGESAGDRVTFGAHESKAVLAALRQMAQRWPQERIGIIGVSLGGAAAVLAPELPGVHALVLESMYPTIEDATRNRLRRVLGPPGTWLAPMLLSQLPWRAQVSLQSLRPLDRMPLLHVPTFVASGAADRHTTPEETRRLHAAAATPGPLWLVEGAAHVDLHAFAPAAYEARVGGFLLKHLRQAAPEAGS